MLELQYRTEGVVLSLSLSAISHGPPLSLELSISTDYMLTVSAYSSVYCLVDRSTNPYAALSARVLYLGVLAHVAVDESKLEAHLTRGEVNKVETTRGSTPHASK